MAEFEFYGAAGRVTGSCHILHTDAGTVLLDCGLVQGGRSDESLNADKFPFDPAGVAAVVLSHAHLDHAGRLPLLVKRGFRGAIHVQHATRALMQILLNDAADIELSVIRRENRRRAELHEPMLEPLFTRDDVADALSLTAAHRYNEGFEVLPGCQARFSDAGHIMGSCVVSVDVEVAAGNTCHLVFSGDLGQYDSPILRDPVTPPRADLVLMETTYGNRRHRDRAASLIELGEVLHAAHQAGGNVLIPAFAVGRSQEILYYLGKHYDEWQVGRWQIFLDSPLAIEASEIYWDFPQHFDAEASETFRERIFMPTLPNLHFTRTSAESKVINRLKRGAIVIAGSGMCNGGRILHHFKRDIGRKETHVIFSGFQPPGTLGRDIIDGAESIRIHGDRYPVRAAIHTIGGLSAHGDQHDLLRWFRGFEATPAGGPPALFLVHGDPEASAGFQGLAGQEGGAVEVAVPGRRIDLDGFARAGVAEEGG